MAEKNIVIAGATFNGVPSIDIPVSGGGSASFVEVSDTTAVASDVAQGKYFYTAAGVKTVGTASGVVVQPLSVTQNGTYNPPSGVDGYAPVTVNVSGGGNLIDYITWEQGGVNSTSNKLYIECFAASQTRVRSVSMLPLTVGHTYEITVDSGYRVAVYCFESNAKMNTSPSYAGSWQETFQFTAPYPYLAIMVKKSDDSAITPSDIANAGIAINDLTS